MFSAQPFSLAYKILHFKNTYISYEKLYNKQKQHAY